MSFLVFSIFHPYTPSKPISLFLPLLNYPPSFPIYPRLPQIYVTVSLMRNQRDVTECTGLSKNEMWREPEQWRGNDFSTGWSSVVCDSTFSSWGSGRCETPSEVRGSLPRRQTHFDNNLLKIYLKSGLWFAVYIPNSEPISDAHGLVRR